MGYGALSWLISQSGYRLEGVKVEDVGVEGGEGERARGANLKYTRGLTNCFVVVKQRTKRYCSELHLGLSMASCCHVSESPAHCHCFSLNSTSKSQRAADILAESLINLLRRSHLAFLLYSCDKILRVSIKYSTVS